MSERLAIFLFVCMLILIGVGTYSAIEEHRHEKNIWLTQRCYPAGFTVEQCRAIQDRP